jgi:hypothetical protein
VRIVAPTVPDSGTTPAVEDVAPPDDPSSATAAIQLFRYLDGLPPERPRQLLRVRDFIQRNAAEDMLLARSLEPAAGWRFPELNLLSFWPFAFPDMGAEWYLRVRDFLHRFEG